jgi:hypothetical protein
MDSDRMAMNETWKLMHQDKRVMMTLAISLINMQRLETIAMLSSKAKLAICSISGIYLMSNNS